MTKRLYIPKHQSYSIEYYTDLPSSSPPKWGALTNTWKRGWSWRGYKLDSCMKEAGMVKVDWCKML
jgi:hypothetical protein